jgi:hypothetical protein
MRADTPSTYTRDRYSSYDRLLVIVLGTAPRLVLPPSATLNRETMKIFEIAEMAERWRDG